jgi:hypothetical protein
MLIAAIITFVLAIISGFLHWRNKQKKEFIVATGCIIALLPIISLIAGICSIIMFLHWLKHLL